MFVTSPPPKVVLYYNGHEFSFKRLVPSFDGVKYATKEQIMRDCISIMRACGYPFDLKCPMPPVFVHGVGSRPWFWLSYCLFFCLDFALSHQDYEFEPWNSRVIWLGDRFCDTLTNKQVYKISLRTTDSDDILRSCLASKDQLSDIVCAFLSSGIKNSYVYIS